MASKNDRELAGSVVMVVGLERVMRMAYEHKDVVQIWPLLKKVKKTSEVALAMSSQRLTNKDRNKIADRIEKMKAVGFENASSYKVYISLCVLLVTDRISELAAKGSPKAMLLRPVLVALEDLYKYFDIRVKNPEYDEAALHASYVWYSFAV